MPFAYYIAGFALLFGVLVFLHELGHYLAAKSLGIGVEVFSLGFGPRVWGFRRGGTDYRLSLIPLGGYVRIFGMEREALTDDPRAFYSRPLGHQLLVTVSGGVINLIIGVLFLVAAFLIGFNVWAYQQQPPVIGWVYPGSSAARAGVQPGDRILAVNGHPVRTWQEAERTILEQMQPEIELHLQNAGRTRKVRVEGVLEPKTGNYFYGILALPPLQIDEVEPDTPAAANGLQPGDVIYRVDDQYVLGIGQFQAYLESIKDRPLEIEIWRQGQVLKKTVRPFRDLQLGRYRLGFRTRPWAQTRMRYPLPAALVRGVKEAVWSVGLFFRALKQMISGELSVKSLSGPISIAQYAGRALAISWAMFFRLMGLISIQLGVINLLPIPALDGGHATMITISGVSRAVTGRGLSPRVREMITVVGVILLIGLTIMILALDILKIWD